MSYFLAALLLIAPLIFIHELGHLIAAKMVGVKVLRFSIGFGKPFARFRMGETEYALAPIPLGGYVRLLGQHPGEHIPAADADRALDAKPLLARAFVMAAGPLANLVLPLALLFFFHLGTTMTTPAVVGTVFTDTAADAAGMHAGDRIISVDGEDIGSFRELQRAIAPHPDEELRVEIERALLSGDLPFDGSLVEILSAKQRGLDSQVLERHLRGVPRDLFELCAGLLEPDPERRLDGAQVLARFAGDGCGPEQVLASTTPSLFPTLSHARTDNCGALPSRHIHLCFRRVSSGCESTDVSLQMRA